MALQNTPEGGYTAGEPVRFQPRIGAIAPESLRQGDFSRSSDDKVLHGASSYVAPQTQTKALQNVFARGRLVGPVKLFAKIIEFWDLSIDDVIPLLGLEDGDFSTARSILSGEATLRGRDVKERLGLLFEIRASLGALFNDRDTENRWLRDVSPSLRAAPLYLLRKGSFRDLVAIQQSVSRMTGS